MNCARSLLTCNSMVAITIFEIKIRPFLWRPWNRQRCAKLYTRNYKTFKTVTKMLYGLPLADLEIWIMTERENKKSAFTICVCVCVWAVDQCCVANVLSISMKPFTRYLAAVKSNHLSFFWWAQASVKYEILRRRNVSSSMFRFKLVHVFNEYDRVKANFTGNHIKAKTLMNSPQLHAQIQSIFQFSKRYAIVFMRESHYHNSIIQKSQRNQSC